MQTELKRPAAPEAPTLLGQWARGLLVLVLAAFFVGVAVFVGGILTLPFYFAGAPEWVLSLILAAYAVTVVPVWCYWCALALAAQLLATPLTSGPEPPSAAAEGSPTA